MTEDRWEPGIAAERLAEYHLTLLDFIGRIDRGVSTGDLYYVRDKLGPLTRAAEHMRKLADELLDEGVRDLAAHTAATERYLVEAGRRGFRVAAALHRRSDVPTLAENQPAGDQEYR